MSRLVKRIILQSMWGGNSNKLRKQETNLKALTVYC